MYLWTITLLLTLILPWTLVYTILRDLWRLQRRACWILSTILEVFYLLMYWELGLYFPITTHVDHGECRWTGLVFLDHHQPALLLNELLAMHAILPSRSPDVGG